MLDDSLVSCIMPTCNRRRFVPQAIRYFLRQDYSNRELVIVDDGADPVADLIPDDLRIRYIRQDRKYTLGENRNHGCGAAKGEIIVHWDDDDWYANWRLSYQVTCLKKTQADICGLTEVYYYEPRSGRALQYIYPRGGRPWVHGTTLCFTRAFWERNPFPSVRVGEDTRFLWTRQPKTIVVLRNSTFYVGIVHANNTSPKRTQSSVWHLCSPAIVHELMGDDWAFYLSGC